MSESRLKRLSAAVQGWGKNPAVQRAGRIIGPLIIASVIGYMVWKLSRIGWAEVLGALPSSPLFYSLFIVRFLIIPAAEVLIYQRVLALPLWRRFGVFLRKRAYNFGFVELSGEAYFAHWAVTRQKLDKGLVLHALKDVNLLSALASNTATVALVLALLLSGRLGGIGTQNPDMPLYVGGSILLCLLLAVGFLLLWRRLIRIGIGDALYVLTVHFARLLAMLGTQALLYWMVLPGVGFDSWLIFLTLNMVIFRIPFLPNKELVFLALSLTLLDQVDASEAAVAGLFVAMGAMGQVLNLAAYLGTVASGKREDGPTSREGRAADRDQV